MKPGDHRHGEAVFRCPRCGYLESVPPWEVGELGELCDQAAALYNALTAAQYRAAEQWIEAGDRARTPAEVRRLARAGGQALARWERRVRAAALIKDAGRG